MVGFYAGQEYLSANNFDGYINGAMTNADRLPIVLYQTKLDIPDQPDTSGFPGDPSLVNWFGVCYDSGLGIATAGSYTFITAADNGVEVIVNGSTIIDQEGELFGGIVNFPMTVTSISLSAGMHDVLIKYWQGYAPYLGLQVWFMPTSANVWSTDPYYSLDATTTPPSADLLQLTAPPGGVSNCP